MGTASDFVTCRVRDGIAEVRLNRPDKLNALTLETLHALAGTARELRGDRTLRAVVIAGEGASFCSGLDFATVLRSPMGMVNGFLPRPWRGTNPFQESCWAWRRLPVPVIAAVHGHCFGGGLQIALAADFRFSAPDAQWSVLENRWGLIPDMTGIRTLSQLVGIDTAKRLTMTAQVLSGTEAADLGLVTELAEDPVAAAREFAEQLSGRSPDALAAAKRLFERTWSSSARRTFSRERVEQLLLLFNANTRAAREAAFRRSTPQFGPRSRR